VDQRNWLHAELPCEGGPDALLLVVATPQMTDACLRLGLDRPLFMDATHGTVKYGHKLVTILVLDEHGKGVPVAWGVLERERAEDYTKLLQVVRDEVLRKAAVAGITWQPSCMLTDDAAAEHAATRCDQNDGP
jgi:hypothetical protein